MKISKSSWHYRFLVWLEGTYSIPDSLCPYVRKLVLDIVLVLGLSLIAGFLAVSLITPLIMVFTDVFAYLNDLPEDQPSFWAISIVVGFLEYLVLFTWFVSWSAPKGWDALTSTVSTNISKKEKDPNVFWEYIKAVHNKFCPSIDFED